MNFTSLVSRSAPLPSQVVANHLDTRPFGPQAAGPHIPGVYDLAVATSKIAGMNRSRRASVLGILCLPMVPAVSAGSDPVDVILRRFRRSARLVAQGRPYREVMAEWGEFGEREERLHKIDARASWFPANPTVYSEVSYTTGVPKLHKDGYVESVSPSDLILKTELFLVRNRVKLKDAERVFGPWYQDPPPPTKGFLTDAYFNPRLVDEKAKFFLAAVSESHADSLTPDSPINSISLFWGDDRRVKANRPW